MSKRFRMTPALRSQIVASIRAGGYPHVAAEAWGVSKDVFDDWMKRGLAADSREPYKSFAIEVREARAQARLRAEMAVFEKDAKTWLTQGPGREADDNPGWSVSVKPAEGIGKPRNPLLDPELLALFRSVLDALAPYPEALDRVTQVLLTTQAQG
ncbi:MAG: hypothetical protein FJ303_23320 [Planctomycetes bacterium]|nr:hypothetical protein [Planctomycetota bacterium]